MPETKYQLLKSGTKKATRRLADNTAVFE